MSGLRTIVFRNLDNARENGYFDPGDLLHGATAADLVADLRAFAEDCYDKPANALLPHVIEWLALNPRT